MKLFIKLLLFFSFGILEAKVFLITYSQHSNKAKSLKQHLITKYAVPESLIELQYSSSACKKREFFFHWCISEEGKIIQLLFDQELWQESFEVFRSGRN